MVRSELVTALTVNLNELPPKDVEFAVNSILSIMGDILAHGGRIEIRGFGSFSLRYRAPRKAHNPRTGETVETKSKYRPHFKPGKALRHRINEAKSKTTIRKKERHTEAESA